MKTSCCVSEYQIIVSEFVSYVIALPPCMQHISFNYKHLGFFVLVYIKNGGHAFLFSEVCGFFSELEFYYLFENYRHTI